MSGFATVQLEDKVLGTKGRIGIDGALRNSPGIGESAHSGPPMTANYVEILGNNDRRRGVQIQNQHATSQVFIKLEASLGTAPGYRIDPGVTYTFPPGLTWRGAIWAKSQPPGADIAVIEFSEPSDEDEG